MKWKECVARSSEVGSGGESMPVGLAERVLRQVQRVDSSAAFSEEFWLRFGMRTLIGVATVFVALVLIHRPQSNGGKLLPPPIEYSIVNYSRLP